MAYSTINKSTAQFDTKLYAGSSSNVTVSGLEFQPDWIWLKNRSATDNHVLVDAVRGSGSYGYKNLYSNLTDAEYVPSDGNASVLSIASSSFVVGQNANTNGNGENFVSWNWKANGQGSANTAGSINTTYTSANTTAGFSIIKYTGNGVAGATIGHGLGAVPKWLIVKQTNSSNNWKVYHVSMGNGKIMNLNDTSAQNTNTAFWNDTTPTSTLITLGTNGAINGNGDTYIMYAFAEKTGYSKFGSYTGNNNSDNAFIYTGFKPKFFITKRSSDTAQWALWDGVRDTGNPMLKFVYPSSNGAEGSGEYIDFLSNGVKIKNNNDKWGNGTYIYMAFGQTLVGSNNVPCTAR